MQQEKGAVCITVVVAPFFGVSWQSGLLHRPYKLRNGCSRHLFAGSNSALTAKPNSLLKSTGLQSLNSRYNSSVDA